MPVRITGMIGVAPPSGETTVHIITGGISKEYTRDFAQAHDKAAFDWALVGYTSRAADGFGVASFCAAHTQRLGYLIAHRPGFVAPTLAARKFATFDNFWATDDGHPRMGLHIITGASDAEMAQDGDWSDKTTRYRRSGEYVAVMRGEWSGQPFDFEGEFYKVAQGASDVLPFQLDDKVSNEDLRLTYRYLDLRRETMARNLRLRHRVVKTMRDVMDAEGFLEIETPILSKSTPEGARDFLVPSRLTPGAFYALPQAPQQYKQLLMVAGV